MRLDDPIKKIDLINRLVLIFRN